MSRDEQSKPRIEFDPEIGAPTLCDLTAEQAERMLAMARREFIAQAAVEFVRAYAESEYRDNHVMRWMVSSGNVAKGFADAANEIWIEASKIAGVEP